MESPLGHEAVGGAEVVVECEGVKVQETAQFVTLVDESRRLKSENLPLSYVKQSVGNLGWVGCSGCGNTLPLQTFRLPRQCVADKIGSA